MAWSDIVAAAPVSARRAADIVASLVLASDVSDETVAAALCEAAGGEHDVSEDAAGIRRSLARGELMRTFGRVERALVALGVYAANPMT